MANSCLCLETTVLWLRAMISAGRGRDSSGQALVVYDCIWLKEACATVALLRPGPATAVSTGSPNFTLFSLKETLPSSHTSHQQTAAQEKMNLEEVANVSQRLTGACVCSGAHRPCISLVPPEGRHSMPCSHFQQMLLPH